ncbi:MAG: hypothetical protein H6725_06685 [Sandaracinaceae bacterium]|nr:hypothetical protein [Sandaracinaceae bacterium]
MPANPRASLPWPSWRSLATPLLACLAMATLAVGCDGCTKAGRLRAGGDHPYVRCMTVDEPAVNQWTVGDLQLNTEGRVLSIGGLDGALRMAAFVGPGPGSADPSAAIAALAPLGAQVTWVLGELGDSEAHALCTLRALAAAPGLSLVLASGRDDFEVLEEAWDALDDAARSHVIDLRPFHAVRVGDTVFALTSGGAGGRYARNRSACGYDEDDLDDVEDSLPDADEARRYMVSWAAPAGGVARDQSGTDGGDPTLSEFMREAGITGGIFAWPPHAAWMATRVTAEGAVLMDDRAADPAAQVVVGRIAGPPVERRDGSRAPNGAVVLELREGGLAILSHAPSGP